MSESKPSPVTYHEYNIPSLNRLFLWSSVLLLVVSVWMIWADYSREWKRYQRDFRDVDVARTRAQIEQADKAINPQKFDQLQARVTAAEEAANAQQAERDKLTAEIDALQGQWYAADQAYKFIKADLDVARFELDEALKHRHEVEATQKRFDAISAEVDEKRLAFEEVDTRNSELQSQLAALESGVTDARRELANLVQERTRLEKRLEKVQVGLVDDLLRNPPLLDFLAPTLKVQQVILPEVHEEVNFLTVPRVDRCHTCHQAIDRPGYDDETIPPVFRTHSRLKVLIGSNHPKESFGCTACHNGSGRSITFVDTAHTPQSAEEGERWEEEHHWHRLHHWDFPMLPLQYTEAFCANCHAEESRIPGADRYNQGRQLIEDYGCFGCHKIDRPGFEELRKVGPDLAHIKGKVQKDWMFKWVRHPKDFRPSTRMPRIWGNPNTQRAVSHMDYPLRDKVEMEAVVRYLMARSKDYTDLPRPPATSGDATRGKWLVENRGCRGCHVVGEGDEGKGREGAHFGPELNQVGSKLTVEWLYAWVRDPQSMWPDTRMPDLRLSDQEALDIATYLKTLRNPDFESAAVPDLANGESRDMLTKVTLEYLRKETTAVDADDRLAKMDEDARYEYLGGKLISKQGCFGCHPGIPGFENAQRIGTELTYWASKLRTQLDFGLIDLPHTHEDWLRAKLLSPRVFDLAHVKWDDNGRLADWDIGKLESKHPQDLLRMPDFELTPEQVDLIMTAVLSFRQNLVQPEGLVHLTPDQKVIEQGRRLARDWNCIGCHVLEDQGGGMEKVLEGGVPYAPPVLVSEYQTLDGRHGKTQQGAKVQPDWFFGFLKGPTPIRPWLNVRMPTFGFSDADATKLVQYFSALAGEPFPYDSFNRAELSPASVADGQRIFTQYKCVSCHLPPEEAARQGVTPDQLAPDLALAKRRLKFEWLKNWLKDPDAIQKNTKMPSFFYAWDEDARDYTPSFPDAETQVEDIRSYLQYHGDPLPQVRLSNR